MMITLNGNRVYLFRCSDIKSDNKLVNILVNMGKCYNKRFVRWSSNIWTVVFTIPSLPLYTFRWYMISSVDVISWRTCVRPSLITQHRMMLQKWRPFIHSCIKCYLLFFEPWCLFRLLRVADRGAALSPLTKRSTANSSLHTLGHLNPGHIAHHISLRKVPVARSRRLLQGFGLKTACKYFVSCRFILSRICA